MIGPGYSAHHVESALALPWLRILSCFFHALAEEANREESTADFNTCMASEVLVQIPRRYGLAMGCIGNQFIPASWICHWGRGFTSWFVERPGPAEKSARKVAGSLGVIWSYCMFL